MNLLRVIKFAPILTMVIIAIHSQEEIHKKKVLFQELENTVVTKKVMVQQLRSSWDEFTRTQNSTSLSNFSLWTSRKSEKSLDAWGTPLKYHTSEKTFALVSAGPDRVFATSDDIEQTLKKSILEKLTPLKSYDQL